MRPNSISVSCIDPMIVCSINDVLWCVNAESHTTFIPPFIASTSLEERNYKETTHNNVKQDIKEYT